MTAVDACAVLSNPCQQAGRSGFIVVGIARENMSENEGSYTMIMMINPTERSVLNKCLWLMQSLN